MYKIDKNYKPSETNNISKLSNENYNYKLLNDDISKMHILPLHCPTTPLSFTDYFNNVSTLSGVAPYIYKKEKHPKDGEEIYKIEYRNFYSNASQQQEDITEENTNKYIHKPNTFNDEKSLLYLETKRKEDFAKPMKSTGKNTLNVIYNDCMNKTTFNYKRFGNDNKYRIDNPIYYQDISKDTRELGEIYTKRIEKNMMNLYSSVFEDMYLMSSKLSDSNEINNNISYQDKTNAKPFL
jgi:hypothetical protein